MGVWGPQQGSKLSKLTLSTPKATTQPLTPAKALSATHKGSGQGLVRFFGSTQSSIAGVETVKLTVLTPKVTSPNHLLGVHRPLEVSVNWSGSPNVNVGGRNCQFDSFDPLSHHISPPNLSSPKDLYSSPSHRESMTPIWGP